MAKVLTAGLLLALLPFLAAADEAADKAYLELLAQLKKGDESVDYTKLRMALTKTSFYNPYHKDPEADKKLAQLMEDEKYKDAVKLAEKRLEENYLEISMHMAAYVACTKLRQKERRVQPTETHHYRVVTGMVESITDSVDGTLTQVTDSLEDEVKEYDDEIARWEEVLAGREERLLREFTEMERLLGEMQTQSTWLTNQIAGINANWVFNND